MALPVDIVGVTSGTLTVSGLPTRVFNPATVEDIRIVTPGVIPVKVLRDLIATQTYTYGASAGSVTGDVNLAAYNAGGWAMPRNGCIVGITATTDLTQTGQGNIRFIAQKTTPGEIYSDLLVLTFSSDGNQTLSLREEAPCGQYLIQAGQFLRYRVEFDGFTGSLAAFQGTIIVDVS
jgi:hypothetical protein